MVNISLSFKEYYNTFLSLAKNVSFNPQFNKETNTFLVEVPIEFANKYGFE
jgi:hypothetical protein